MSIDKHVSKWQTHPNLDWGDRYTQTEGLYVSFSRDVVITSFPNMAIRLPYWGGLVDTCCKTAAKVHCGRITVALWLLLVSVST